MTAISADSLQPAIFGSARLCAIRVVRLNSDCTPREGENNAVATAAIVKADVTPDFLKGMEYLLVDGCGDISLYAQNVDRLKKNNVTMELATRDFELIELLSGATLIVNGTAQNIGVGRRGVGAVAPGFVSVELWSRTIDNTGTCHAVGGPTLASWYRTVWPNATFTLGKWTFENAIATCTLEGFVTPNPAWGTGGFDDYPGTGAFPADTPEGTFLDLNGPPTLAGGYIDIPHPSVPTGSYTGHS